MARRKIIPVQFEGFRRYSVAHFLIAIVILFVATPFLQHIPGGDFIEKVLGSLVLLSGVAAIGGRRNTMIAGLILVAPALLARWIDHLFPGALPKELILLATLAALAFVVFHLFRYVLKAPRVNAEVLCAAIATYLLLGSCWAIVFSLVARLDPDSFVFTNGPTQYHVMAGFEAIYFSVGTLSGVCYGDITPVSGVARMLALLEGMIGLFYFAVLISRLVSLYSSDRTLKENETPVH